MYQYFIVQVCGYTVPAEGQITMHNATRPDRGGLCLAAGFHYGLTYYLRQGKYLGIICNNITFIIYVYDDALNTILS